MAVKAPWKLYMNLQLSRRDATFPFKKGIPFFSHKIRKFPFFFFFKIFIIFETNIVINL